MVMLVQGVYARFWSFTRWSQNRGMASVGFDDGNVVDARCFDGARLSDGFASNFSRGSKGDFDRHCKCGRSRGVAIFVVVGGGKGGDIAKHFFVRSFAERVGGSVGCTGVALPGRGADRIAIGCRRIPVVDNAAAPERRSPPSCICADEINDLRQ